MVKKILPTGIYFGSLKVEEKYYSLLRQEKELCILIRQVRQLFLSGMKLHKYCPQDLSQRVSLILRLECLTTCLAFMQRHFPRDFQSSWLATLSHLLFLGLLIQCKHNREPLKHFNRSLWVDTISFGWFH